MAIRPPLEMNPDAVGVFVDLTDLGGAPIVDSILGVHIGRCLKQLARSEKTVVARHLVSVLR